MTKVLFAAAEGAPFYKTGGLGDVTYALPKALQKLGVDIRVVLPFYPQQFPDRYREQLELVAQFQIPFGGSLKYVGVRKLTLGQVPVYFIDNQEFFNREALYGYWDDGGRFGFFAMAIIEMLQVIDFIPDVLHVNDWHTAMVPVLLKDKYSWLSPLANIKTQLTIHNLQFQGWFPPSILSDVFGIGRQYFNDDGFAQFGQVNFMKGGINFADLVSTVSPTYAKEIQTPQFGEQLDGTLRKQQGKLRGILNGIDTELYDPLTDPHLTSHYDAKHLDKKVANKVALQKAVGLPISPDPLFGMVTRLTRQKGAHLLPEALRTLVLNKNAQVVILGTGDPALEAELESLHGQFPGQIATLIRFDEALAQQIYAGSDFFMMPSEFEPSGLAQMMAMRYGTLPVVHEVGGLRDSVTAYNQVDGSGTGFSFWEYTPAVLANVLQLATDVYQHQPAAYRKLQQQAMAMDFDWKNAAGTYLAGYKDLTS